MSNPCLTNELTHPDRRLAYATSLTLALSLVAKPENNFTLEGISRDILTSTTGGYIRNGKEVLYCCLTFSLFRQSSPFSLCFHTNYGKSNISLSLSDIEFVLPLKFNGCLNFNTFLQAPHSESVYLILKRRLVFLKIVILDY